MTRDPIERLLEEHRSILRPIDPLRRAVDALRREGPAALPAALPALRDAARMFDEELLAHARREDEALFPAVERVLGEGAGPTAVMRAEHRDIEAQAGSFRATLRELHDLQHPALERAGAELAALATRGGPVAAIVDTAGEVIRLLDEHFAKEEQVLFPMTREILRGEDLAAVARAMDALDRTGAA